MLMPSAVQSAEDRARVAAALSEFAGRVLLPAGLSDPEARALKQTIAGRLASEVDPAGDIWIASGRLEHPRSLLSLLHARVEGAQATVDLLLALPAAKGGAAAYEGYGELSLLTLLLERRNVHRLRIPLALDEKRSGLASAGWRSGPDAAYEHRPVGA